MTLQVEMTASALFSERLRLKAPHLSSANFIPAFLYGTAWKKGDTTELVYRALCTGFTGIDTANQPKHYREDLVGVGLRRALAERRVTREDLYLQTKFTAVGGQDASNMPYDPEASVSDQLRASITSSLAHLTPEENSIEASYIDTLVLHSPFPSIEDTIEAWHTLEEYVPTKIHNLGISNCNLFQLMDICERAKVKPAVVQNRFYRQSKYDIGLREFCRENSIVYQSFWTLTANPELVWSSEVGQLANHVRISPQAALYCLVLGLGGTVMLNGTKKEHSMRDDLKALELVRAFAIENSSGWHRILHDFRKVIGESSATAR